jgi:protocatechuate 3,4-dioxygenase beta subunit
MSLTALVLALFISPLMAQQTARVEGTVRTSAGEPVARATIQLVNSTATLTISPNGDRGLAGFTTTTDDSGKFVLENVQPGRNYRLIAMKAGFLDSSLPNQLTLNSGETIRDLVIQMAEQGVITGRVMDVNGNPLVGASVSLQQSRYANGMRLLVSSAGQATDDRGMYRFANVSPGRYYIAVSDQTNRRQETNPDFKSGQQANVLTYYPSADNADAARPIDVTGNGAQGIDIVMRRVATYALRGRVTDEVTGAPLSGAGVAVVTVNGRTVRANPYARQTGTDGAFEFTAMPPATYGLEVRIPGAPNPRIGRAEAIIASSDVSGVSIRVGNGISILGTVQLDDGGRLPSSFFAIPRTVVLTEGPLRAALRLRGRVGNDGTFTFDGVPAGRFQVGFIDLAEDVYVKSIRFGDLDALHSPLDLTSGRGGSMTITLSNKPAILDGVVRGLNGASVIGVAVALWPRDANGSDPTGGIRRVVTDQNSSFRFIALPPGQYYVAAFPGVDQALLESHDFVSRFNAEAARVELSEGMQGKLDAPILSGDRIAEEVAKLP